MEYENAVERVMRRPKVVKKYGKDVCEGVIRQMNKWNPLDCNSDAPLPQWACEILRIRDIGFRLRFAMLIEHNYDITGVNEDFSRLRKENMRTPPPIKTPDWLTQFREKQAAIAKEYLERKDKENNNNGIPEV